MTYLIGGDAHNPPQGLSPETIKFLETPADTHIFAGDFLNLLELGIGGYRFSATIKELYSWSQRRRIILVEGNHDPDTLLRQITPTNIWVATHFDIGPYRVIHGHQFGGYWAWLSDFAFIQKLAPSLFAWLAARGFQLSTPNQYKTTGGMAKVYSHALGFIWAGALAYSEAQDKIVAMGHTHTPFRAEFRPNPKVGVIDLGTIAMEKEWLRIEV